MKEYGKNAKPILYAFGILSFLVIIVSLIYMNQYSNIWFYETVTGINGNDLTTTGQGTNSNMLAFFDNNREAFNSYFKLSLSTSVSAVSYVGTKCMDLYRQLNDVNDLILYLGLVSVVMFAIILLLGNGSRRIYYKSNLIVGIICPLVAIIFAIVVIVKNSMLISVIGGENNEFYNLVDGVMNTSTSAAAIDSVISAGDVSSLTIILVDIFLVVFICYSVFVIIYSYLRYKNCKEERNEIIKKAVAANE